MTVALDGGVLSYQQARAFYDRLGSKLDWQAFYEDPATEELVSHARFEEARSICEFGCGTGRFAEHLLRRHLPATASYIGIDVSSTMVNLARHRLGRFGSRIEVRLTEGEPKIETDANSYDRFVCNYVLDLLSVSDIRAVLAEADRVLVQGGLLALTSLTYGPTPTSRLVERVWTAVHSFRPALLGGCRPIALVQFLPQSTWAMHFNKVITRFGIASEVVVAEKASPAPHGLG